MRALFRALRRMRFQYEPLILVTIHRARLLHNLKQFQAANPGVAVAPVLKSNAYGHGLVTVAKILAGETVPFLCIDSYVEAVILRNEGIRAPLLTIGYTPLPNIERNALKNVSFGVMSLAELKRLAAGPGLRKPVSIHLKIDTGMHRHGIRPEELSESLDIIAKSRVITLEGAYSHFADADASASPLTERQIELWNQCVRTIKEKIPSVRFFHLSNTAGNVYAKKIDGNAMRLGIGLYGIDTSASPKLDMLPALEMKTRITSVRTIHAGESVGYTATFTAAREMKIATIPVGYAEGLDRRLSNAGVATVAGVECHFVGRVNMNITSIDVSALPDPKLDDEVLVISANRDAQNSIEKMADRCGTIPYELLVRLPAQLRRVVVD